MNNYDTNFDLKHIWHPYSSMCNPITAYPVISAKKIYLKLSNGKRIIDGMSSWWSAIHGYNNPILNRALKKQINKMSHVMFGGITHPPAIALCKNLILLTPKELECIFLADSGSVAIEVSMKMAFQYWQSLGFVKKVFLTIKNGYHGDTFAAMSVCDPKKSMHNIYNNWLPKHLFAKSPKSKFGKKWLSEDINSFYALLKENHKIIAGIILEPIVQGVGGMNFYHPNYLYEVRLLANSYKIPLIIDEIATGFGRTGKLFAYEYANIVPDILCLGKSITGGTMTLSAVISTRHIAEVISQGICKCLMHGPTFMGNPLACSVANENIKILKKNHWQKQVKNIEKQLIYSLLPLNSHEKVYDVRVLGAIGVVECKYIINIKKIQKFFVSQGVWIRPFKNLIYITPPYIIDKKSLKKLTNAIILSLNYNDFFYINL
ncbi:Adenosylmethionine-8-amino-7-oxononanoate aminotransferase [Buchnera aphidicola (Neophyllaphis podocarpi)]|uniref:adenosylmethionine--8-amino-7-oxononanoate transaminase n=1 Tax=Buchnera aphidicola TaxID=9 RepID=UPI0031B8B199